MKDSVKVAGHVYEIIRTESVDINENWGLIQYKNMKIKLDKELKGSRLEETLTHEIIHAVLSESGCQGYLNSKEVDKELFISLIENTFYQFLKDNTDFFGCEDSPRPGSKAYEKDIYNQFTKDYREFKRVLGAGEYSLIDKQHDALMDVYRNTFYAEVFRDMYLSVIRVQGR